MDGLPGETYEDLAGIGEIARNIMDINYRLRGRQGGRFRVTVSVSNFVPEAAHPVPVGGAGYDRRCSWTSMISSRKTQDKRCDLQLS